MKLLILLLFSTIFVVAKCGDGFDNGPAKQDRTLDRQFVMDMMFSSWKLYLTVRQAEFENFIFSPSSLQHVLGMMLAGAGGETRNQILGVLEAKTNKYDIFEQFEILTEKMFDGSSSSMDNPTKLANRIYLKNGFTPKKNFRDILSKSFQTSTQIFKTGTDRFGRDQTQQTIDDMNQWVSDQTGGNIRDLVTSDDVTDQSLLVLINALYFQAKWLVPFDTTVDGRDIEMLWWDASTQEHVTIKAMQTGARDFPYYYIDHSFSTGMQYFAIPYDTDADVFFVIAVPKRKYPRALQGFEIHLSSALLNNYLPKLTKKDSETGEPGKPWMKNTEMPLIMPSFSADRTLDLIPALKKLGAMDMFGSSSDFTGIISSPPLVINTLKQAAKIEVTPEGTTAAASTIGGFAPRGLMQLFEVNQPFFYGIYQDGGFLFMGNVYNP